MGYFGLTSCIMVNPCGEESGIKASLMKYFVKASKFWVYESDLAKKGKQIYKRTRHGHHPNA